MNNITKKLKTMTVSKKMSAYCRCWCFSGYAFCNSLSHRQAFDPVLDLVFHKNHRTLAWRTE